jgi:hypothetical protein
MIKLLVLFSNIIVLSFFSLLSKIKIQSNNLRSSIFFLFPLILISIFYVFYIQDYIYLDNDIYRYISFYSQIDNFEKYLYYSLADLDFVFFGLMFIFKYLGFTSIFFIKFILGISVLILFRGLFLFFKDTSDYFLCLLLIMSSSSFYFLYGNVIRQGLATSILIFLISSNAKERLLNIFMPFIHKASIPYFLRSLVILKKKILIIYLIISFIVCFYVINIFTQLLFLTNLSSLDFYLNVFTRESSDNSQLKLIILSLNTLYFTLFLNKNRMDKKQLNLFKSYFVFSCLTICIYQIDGIFSRLNYFCIFLSFPLHIVYMSLIRNKFRKIILYFILLLFSIIYSFYVFNHPSIIFNLDIK